MEVRATTGQIARWLEKRRFPRTLETFQNRQRLPKSQRRRIAEKSQEIRSRFVSSKLSRYE